jgi:arsenite-transporting ATPase
MPESVGSGYFSRWLEIERRELESIEQSFPVPIKHVSLRPREVIGTVALEALARDLFGDDDPAARFAKGRPIRFRRVGGRTRMEIDLPGITKEEVSVSAKGAELFLQVRDARRSISLPDGFVGRSIEKVRFREPLLEIHFGDGES